MRVVAAFPSLPEPHDAVMIHRKVLEVHVIQTYEVPPTATKLGEEKVVRSGLDLSGRARPTLGVLPRGNWLRHYYYDFPALLAGGLDQLIDYSLQQFDRAIASAAPITPFSSSKSISRAARLYPMRSLRCR